MNFKKFVHKIFFGFVVLEEVESVINRKIQVQEDIFGKKRLVVGGLTQSGRVVERIWLKAVREIKNLKNKKLKNVLILGLGAGSAAKVINNFFGGAKITGIEIDRKIIRFGKKYFGLGKIKNLKIVNEDAFCWLLSCYHDLNHQNKNFDLILVDVYLGDKVPARMETEKFLKMIKKVLALNGTVIFNRLYYSEKKEKADNFEKKLRKIFPKIETKKVGVNKLFLCQNIKTK